MFGQQLVGLRWRKLLNKHLNLTFNRVETLDRLFLCVKLEQVVSFNWLFSAKWTILRCLLNNRLCWITWVLMGMVCVCFFFGKLLFSLLVLPVSLIQRDLTHTLDIFQCQLTHTNTFKIGSIDLRSACRS